MTLPLHCTEDALLVHTGDTYICGHAADDYPYTLLPLVHTGDTPCALLVGTGAYDAGAWSSYTCATYDYMPDTAMAHDADIPLPLILPAVLFVASVIRAVKMLLE
jgi:hypothetical protein